MITLKIPTEYTEIISTETTISIYITNRLPTRETVNQTNLSISSIKNEIDKYLTLELPERESKAQAVPKKISKIVKHKQNNTKQT